MLLLHFESLGLSNYDLTPQQNHRYISNLKDSEKERVSRRITHKHSHLIVIAVYNTTVSIAFIPVFGSIMEGNSFSSVSMMSCIRLTFFSGSE